MLFRAAGIVFWICTSNAWAQAGHESCVDVQVGTAQSYACINQQLQGVAHEAQKSPAAAPYTAQSPGNQTGQFNEDATRERLGGNFGKSVTPVRPTTNYPAAFGAPK